MQSSFLLRDPLDSTVSSGGPAPDGLIGPPLTHPETLGFQYTGTTGNDVQSGTTGNDEFDYFQGGNDTLNGLAGDDKFVLGGAFTAADQINGGGGNDTLVLNGNYAAGIVCNATSIVSIETIQLAGGHSYSLTLNDANLAAGQTMTITATGLTATDSLTFGGGLETDGSFIVNGGAGPDDLTFNGGVNTVNGGVGNDQIHFGGNFSASDAINGGDGQDTLVLQGDYSGGLVFGANTVRNLEDLIVITGFSYDIKSANATVAAGQTLTVLGELSTSDTLIFDGSLETDGHFILVGGSGADTLTGGALSDDFETEEGGSDTIKGGGGDDTVNAGAAFSAADQVDGGLGQDTLHLSGDYTNANSLTLANTTLQNVETITFDPGFSYALTMGSANVAVKHTMTIDAHALNPTDALFFNGSAAANGSFHVLGGSGGDLITLGVAPDSVSGNAGDDLVSASHFVAADTIDGGAGHDSVDITIAGNSALTLGAATLTNVEVFLIAPQVNAGAVSFHLVTNDANVAAGQTLTIGHSGVAGAHLIMFVDGSAETDGHFVMYDDVGNDHLTGGAQSDLLHIDSGGDDTVSGLDGDDTIFAGAAFGAADHIDGGAGTDTLELFGDYTGAVNMASLTLRNVEIIKLDAGFNYSLQMNDGNVAAGQTLTVDGSALGLADVLNFDGGLESDGTFSITGGLGRDELVGGALNDVIKGGGGNDDLVGLGGADTLNGGGGSDTYDYGAVSQSTGVAHDTIVAFDALHDGFALTTAVSAIDAGVTHGTLTTANFDVNLAAAIGAAQLAAGDAVLFTPDAGNFSGHTILVVDANGVAGYQAGLDYVFDVTGAINLGSLSTSDFTISE